MQPNEQATVYCTWFKVRPSPHHAQYFEVQGAFLAIYLYAESPESAHERAIRILQELPYEMIGAVPDRVKIPKREPQEGAPEWEIEALAAAASFGLGLALIGWPPSGSEENFATVDLG